jgi:methylglutamate dehydrogenase subunit B
MRIDCPFCGSRDQREFTVMGDAALAQRPDPAAPDAVAEFATYLHARDNPAGLHRELWYHGAGCQSWLVLSRSTRTHQIESVELARTMARGSR